MRGLSTLVDNVTIRQLQTGVLHNTKEQFMKVGSNLKATSKGDLTQVIPITRRSDPRHPIVSVSGNIQEWSGVCKLRLF